MEITPGQGAAPTVLHGTPGTTRHRDPATSPGCISPTPVPRHGDAGLTPGTISVGDRQERNPPREAKRRLLSALPIVSPLMERSRREEEPGAAPVMEKPWGSPGLYGYPAGPQQDMAGTTCLGHVIIHGDSPETRLEVAWPQWDRGGGFFPGRCTNYPQVLGSGQARWELHGQRDSLRQSTWGFKKSAGPRTGLTPLHDI